MKIGITERGDASLDFSWVSKLEDVDGAILITKNASEKFRQQALTVNKPVIVHATCTGYGGTMLEPYVPKYREQLQNIVNLIAAGFPKDRVVLRVDPIIPTEQGIKVFRIVLDSAIAMGLLPGLRVRVSILDNYPHVRQRFVTLGYSPLYNGYFSPCHEDIRHLEDTFSWYPNITFETCAEDQLSAPNVKALGCISYEDLTLMGLIAVSMSENPQNRNGCHCLACKTELLCNRYRCAHKCAYCYWKG